MAKLKGPLFSLGASGQIGKALVFFPWKGLDVVRQHVVPSNPQTTLQTTQRGYLTNAVTRIHAAQARATNPMSELDKSAYALWAAALGKIETWFNRAVAHMTDQQVDSKNYPLFYDATLTPGANQVVFDVYAHYEAPDDAHLFYGTSPTAMLNSEALTIAGAHLDKTIAGLTTGVKYYFQVRVDAGDDAEGARSGIYYAYAA